MLLVARAAGLIVPIEGPDHDATRRALRGWAQRLQALIEIARDTDDLTARLPVLDTLATELVSSLASAITAFDHVAHHPRATMPAGADLLRDALGEAHDLLRDITLWHRGPSVAAMRKARDHFAAAADRLDDQQTRRA